MELYRKMAGGLSAKDAKSSPPAARKISRQETQKRDLGPDQLCTTDERFLQRKSAQATRPCCESCLHASSKKDEQTSNITTTGTDWTRLYADLSSAIQVRHYSPKTLHSYRSWLRQFQTFVKSKDATLIGVDDVKAFLTWLAVERHVSAMYEEKNSVQSKGLYVPRSGHTFRFFSTERKSTRLSLNCRTRTT